MNKVFALLEKLAQPKELKIIGLSFVLIAFIIMPLMEQSVLEYSGNVSVLDLEFCYSPDKAYTMMNAYRHEGRAIYAFGECSADLAYPLVYTLFYSTLLIFLLQQQGFYPKWKNLIYIIFIAFIAHLMENICIFSLLRHFPQRIDYLVFIASFSTSIKWIGITITLFSILFLITRKLFFTLFYTS